MPPSKWPIFRWFFTPFPPHGVRARVVALDDTKVDKQVCATLRAADLLLDEPRLVFVKLQMLFEGDQSLLGLIEAEAGKKAIGASVQEKVENLHQAGGLSKEVESNLQSVCNYGAEAQVRLQKGRSQQLPGAGGAPKQSRSGSSFSRIKKLQESSSLPAPVASSFHWIRVRRNDELHVLGEFEVTRDHAETAIKHLLDAVEWHYCKQKSAGQLQSIYRPPGLRLRRVMAAALLFSGILVAILAAWFGLAKTPRPAPWPIPDAVFEGTAYEAGKLRGDLIVDDRALMDKRAELIRRLGDLDAAVLEAQENGGEGLALAFVSKKWDGPAKPFTVYSDSFNTFKAIKIESKAAFYSPPNDYSPRDWMNSDNFTFDALTGRCTLKLSDGIPLGECLILKLIITSRAKQGLGRFETKTLSWRYQ
jgi:hypothetical protein